MNILKLDNVLCLALQSSEGPFDIKIKFIDHNEWACISKQEIENLSNLDTVLSIESCLPRSDRRWNIRVGKRPRRNYKDKI